MVAKLLQDHKYWYKEKIQHPLYQKVLPEGLLEKFDIKQWKAMDRTALPEGFYWDTVDPNNDEIIQEITDFLNNNYVESESKDFLIGNSVQFVKW